MKIERAWLRIIVSVIVGGIAGSAAFAWFMFFGHPYSGGEVPPLIAALSIFLSGPTITTVFLCALTPRETKDEHTRCGKCGYILNGLTEPRCSECGARI